MQAAGRSLPGHCLHVDGLQLPGTGDIPQPAGAELGRARLGSAIHTDDAELRTEAADPFEIIQR